jgi:phage-related minor tail protein
MAGVLGRAFVQVFADLSKFTPGLREEIKKALDEETKGLRFEELDKSAHEAGGHAADEMARGMDDKLEPNMERSGRKGGNGLWRGLVSGFSVAAAVFMPTLIALAVELVAALAPAVTALAATMPAAIFAAIGALATLKMATNGVGDALKSAFDPKKAKQFDEAMKKLAPSAQDFVREIQKLHPAFHQLQQDVQQVFFNQLEGTLTRVSRTLLPTLRRGFQSLSVDLGKMANNFIAAFGGHQADIASIFIAAHEALKPFIPALGQFAGALTTIAAVAGPLFASLSGGFAKLLLQFSSFIEQAANSGALAKFFDDALVLLRQLGGLLHNVFDLVTTILNALQADGGQALGFISSLIGQLAAFFATAQGKQFLANLFLLLNTALASMQAILIPLLPAIAELVNSLSGGLVDALNTLTPLLVGVANWLGQHPDLLKAAAAAWLVYRAALVAVAVYEAIVDALNPVGWVILAVAAIAAGAYLIYKNWGVVTSALKSAWEAIKGFFSGIWNWIVGVGKDIANWFTVTLPNFFSSLPGKIWAALQALPGMLGQFFLDALHAAGEAIGIGIGLLLAFFIKLPGWIWDAIKAIGHLFVDLWHLALDAGKKILDAGIAAVIYIFTVLPGKIGAFLLRLPGIIAGAFKSAWEWAKREVVSGADAVVDFVKKLPGRISGFFGNVGHAILGGLKSGINAVIGGFNSGIDRVASMVHIGLPHIPLLASGGLVKAPTLAVVGEAGPEAVVPMGDPNRAAAVAKATGLLDILGSRMGNVGTTLVKVYLGTREITDILDVQIDKKMDAQANELAYGTR